MSRFYFLGALLLGLVGAANGQILASFVARPEHPAYGSDGCNPDAQVSVGCPVQMICVSDPQYTKGGRCECSLRNFHISKKMAFDDSEWDEDGFTTDDCVLHGIRWIPAITYFVMFIMLTSLTVTAIIVVRELVNAKALKFNATGVSLILMLYQALGVGYMYVLYFIVTMDLEKTGFMYEKRYIMIFLVIYPCEILVEGEIGVTWIDLYDRTQKMSKSSSRSLNIMRTCIRGASAFLILAGIACIGVFAPLIPSYGFIGLFITGFIGPITVGIFIQVAGYLITKSLCPDKHDVSNPNWKVAESIRRGVAINGSTRILYLCTLLIMAVSTDSAILQCNYFYGAVPLWWFHTARSFGWIHYLIYGNRKHLKNYANENASAYFGFSTIGLNKTLTSASSKVSTMSSAISTRSQMPADDE